jgi:hypothetical protein
MAKKIEDPLASFGDIRLNVVAYSMSSIFQFRYDESKFWCYRLLRHHARANVG